MALADVVAGNHIIASETVDAMEEVRDGIPYAKLQRAAVQNMANDTNVPVEWDTAIEDTHNGHDLGTNPSRYTFPQDGVYEVEGLASWEANATGRRAVHLLLNGAGVNGTQIILAAQAIGATSLFFSTKLRVTAGQYIEVNQWQNSGAARNTATGLPAPTVTITYVRA